MKTARYKQLEQVRHNFVFHYNHADQGAHTATALSTLVSELDTHDDFEVAGRILFEGSGRPSRFSVADKAMDVAWQSMFGFSPKVVESASENSSAVVSAFIFELGVTLIKFSDLWLTNWVAEHELQL